MSEHQRRRYNSVYRSAYKDRHAQALEEGLSEEMAEFAADTLALQRAAQATGARIIGDGDPEGYF